MCPNSLKNTWLLVGSLIFYAWGEPRYIILMIISIFVNYIIGIFIGTTVGSKKTVLLILGLLLNLGLLFFFKYFTFVSGLIIETFVGEAENWVPDISLPIGISFYTLQAISYLVDLYKGKYPAQKNIISLGLYISFFPQLIAGPIVRYVDINYQIQSRKYSKDQLIEGISRFSYGLGKKVILANNLGAVVDRIDTIGLDQMTGGMAWLGSICFTLQLYYDFSGYSDMAIGLGKMFGFDFKENFSFPHLSKSISEFWRRWHISLGSWFREYVYIPLGGNRKGQFRTSINLLVVFAITGIWHGANITFFIWGIFHGVLIVLERLFYRDTDKSKWNNLIGFVYAQLMVNFGLVIFRNDSLIYSLKWLERMLLPWKYAISDYNMVELIRNSDILCIIVGVALAGPLQSLYRKINTAGYVSILLTRLWQFVIVILTILILSGNTYNPFIYFQF